jgi:hypothetical protein
MWKENLERIRPLYEKYAKLNGERNYQYKPADKIEAHVNFYLALEEFGIHPIMAEEYYRDTANEKVN